MLLVSRATEYCQESLDTRQGKGQLLPDLGLCPGPYSDHRDLVAVLVGHIDLVGSRVDSCRRRNGSGQDRSRGVGSTGEHGRVAVVIVEHLDFFVAAFDRFRPLTWWWRWSPRQSL
jgi:hypothetical protein